MHRITKGLELPITGEPEQTIVPGPTVTRVGLLGPDYLGLKPSVLVQPGDRVKAGTPLFRDKATAGVVYTSPASGVVAAVQRGDRRAFQSVIIDVEGQGAETFTPLFQRDATSASREQITQLLADSGLWPSFRTRPFNKVPLPGTVPRSIFVQAIDTNPLAVDPVPVIRQHEREFQFGVLALSRLTDGRVFVCRPLAVTLPGDDLPGVQAAEFEGPHPAGLPGTHIHFLDPVGPGKVVWFVNYQDVIAIGRLLTTGELLTERVISVAGPGVRQPQLLRTVLGADVSQLVAGRLQDGRQRVISGSVFSGRTVAPPCEFLGRYHLQVSVLPEGDQREFLGWVAPGGHKFSVTRVYRSALNRAQRFAFTTSLEGSRRAMVPIGTYEQVMPLDILPTFLLRALITGDSEQAQALGCLELDEDDVSLCTFVCPGKYEYGPLLRKMLTSIEVEG